MSRAPQPSTAAREGGGAAPPPAHWDDFPIALADGKRLRAISSAAARARVRLGMTLSEARALCAGLEVWDWDAAAIARAVTETTGALLAATPQVTPVAGDPGLWWAGAGGLDELGGERELLRTLSGIARVWHPRARVAVAGSCVAARAATWASVHAARGSTHAPPHGAFTVIVPPGNDAAYLASAPLALIPMPDELRAALDALGIVTAGALAALDAEDVERRWGSEGLESWRLARGEDRRRPVLARPSAPRSAGAELAAPTTTVEPLLFLVRAALDQLAARLVADGRVAGAIAITLALDTPSATGTARPHTITRQVRFPRPSARIGPLFEQCRALLEKWVLPSPACGVTVDVVETVPASGEQGDLLAQGWRDPAAADAAFARLRAELGPGTVVRPVARDEHRVERAGEWDEGGGARGEEREQQGTGVRGQGSVRLRAVPSNLEPRPSSLALRLLSPPEPAEVERADGRIAAVWWRGQRFAVDRALGPERLSGDWWKDAYARDYWRCEGGGEAAELLIFLDQMEERWYVQGWYD